MSHNDIPGAGNNSPLPLSHESAAKTNTLRDQIRYGIKLIAGIGGILLLFCLIEKLHLYY